MLQLSRCCRQGHLAGLDAEDGDGNDASDENVFHDICDKSGRPRDVGHSLKNLWLLQLPHSALWCWCW